MLMLLNEDDDVDVMMMLNDVLFDDIKM